MSNYGPLFFNRNDDPDFIPAAFDPRKRVAKEEAVGFDPTQPSTARDSVIQRREVTDSAHWNMRPVQADFAPTTNELHYQFFGNKIRSEDVNKKLSEARAQFGKDAVKTNVFWVSRFIVAAQIGELIKQGYTRAEHRERANNPCLCFVQTPARQWK